MTFQPEFTVTFVEQALGIKGYFPSPLLPQATYPEISTDSRHLTPGALFVALKGDQFDGHDFIAGAVSKGAGAVVCSEDWFKKNSHSTFPCFAVADPEDALRKLGRAWREQFTLPVVLVAGSVGKTTTKELLAALLGGKFSSVLKTEGSQNGFVGIPLTLLKLRPHHQVAVIEVGIDEVGAMAQHLPLVNASIAIVTQIGPEHLEKLIDLPTIAREENLALEKTIAHGGKAVVNLDDEWTAPLAKRFPPDQSLTFSMRERNGGSAPHRYGEWLAGQLTIQAEDLFEKTFVLETLLPGHHNAQNLLGAVTIALELGLTPAEIKTGLAQFKPAGGRSEVVRLPTGPTILCDFYNSNPSSLAAGLKMLREQSPESKGRRWACLADMLEMGPQELDIHRAVANELIAHPVERVLLFGPRMRSLAEELEARRYPHSVRHFAEIGELSQTLQHELSPEDTVLIKGSRGMKMEKVFQALQAP